MSVESHACGYEPRPGEWPTYNGVPGGNRYSALTQINAQNVSNLQLEWVYSLRGPGLETTPIVSDGVMYVTAPGEVCALDSGTGREIWCYSRPTGGRGNANPANAEVPAVTAPRSQIAASRCLATASFSQPGTHIWFASIA